MKNLRTLNFNNNGQWEYIGIPVKFIKDAKKQVKDEFLYALKIVDKIQALRESEGKEKLSDTLLAPLISNLISHFSYHLEDQARVMYAQNGDIKDLNVFDNPTRLEKYLNKISDLNEDDEQDKPTMKEVKTESKKDVPQSKEKTIEEINNEDQGWFE